jgi:hypothetical protein
MSSRATVRIDEHLMRQLKERAQREKISLTRCINQVLQQGLLAGNKPRKRKRFVQKTYNMGQPLIDLTHTNAVIDELEAQEFLRKMAQGK